jgi:hypothetical protein
MPRHHDDDEEDEDERDNELPDESDQDPAGDDSPEATEECPHCEAEVYWGAERCPACGRYLSEEDAPTERKSWFLIAVVVGLLLVILWSFL